MNAEKTKVQGHKKNLS